MKCKCGSGKDRYELVDAAGIYCGRVCEDCEASERAKFKPAIFEANTPYAVSGDEQDIDIDYRETEDE